MNVSTPALCALGLVLATWSNAQPASAHLRGGARHVSAAAGLPNADTAGDSTDAIFYPKPGYEGEYIALQQQLVAAYGGASGVQNAIMAGYAVPPHLGAVITGAGFALANTRDVIAFELVGHPVGGVDLNSPFFLLYAPTGQPGQPPDGEEGTFADTWPDPPYELIGWLYGAAYDPASKPHLEGIPKAAWFVHEAGWHMSDGTQILTPPQEDCPGRLAQDAPDHPRPKYVNDQGKIVFAIGKHGRAWDVHLWRNPDVDQVPFITINEPFTQLPGGTLDLPDGAFFYPACPTQLPSPDQGGSGPAW